MQPRSHNQAGSACRRPHAPAAGRAGFTLVEMLVSVALVVLMMTMFATVFQLAAGSVGTQRGMAENDQRARSLTTVILSDLGEFVRDPETEQRVVARTFKQVLPWQPGDDPTDPAENADLRQGYFYISENDINNDADDVLQFTVAFAGGSGELYYGKATHLFGPFPNVPGYDLATDSTTFTNSNEPDRDDGYPDPDGSADSNAAEICYFLRDGRLYRRVLLLRHPFSGDAADVQPTDQSGTRRYFDPNNDGNMPTPQLYTGNFWNDFDFSAYYGIDGGGDPMGARFHGIDDLSNATGNFPLGHPKFRFGHNHEDGLPREYVGRIDATGTAIGTGNDAFIGRFTHEETSFFNDTDGNGVIDLPQDVFFGYPQAESRDGDGDLINDGNPMLQNPSARPLNLVGGIVTDTSTFTSPTNPGIVFSGPRRAEDLLLSNVHAFDVKVWDDALSQFVDVGHNITGGTFELSERDNTSYGPNGPNGNRVFDTWNPKIDIEASLDADSMGNDPPPFELTEPLKAIRITIRYLDISSDQMRQLTLDISLTE